MSNGKISAIAEQPGLIDWDDAFDNSGYFPDSEQLTERWQAEAAAYRTEFELAAPGRIETDLVYGPQPRNRIDLFRPETTPRGLIVFIHGGYWHLLDKSWWSHFAQPALAAGWAMAIPSYPLAPEAAIGAITKAVCSAIGFAAARIAGPIRLVGHSAGGHLVTRMVCDDSCLPAEVIARLQKVVAVSGVFDLRPLLQTHMNQILQLTEDEAIAESPALHSPLPDIEVRFWVGAGERPEFLRQTRLITETWRRGGNNLHDCYEADKNHFTVIEGLARPQSALIAELTT